MEDTVSVAEGRSFSKVFGSGEDSMVDKVAKIACRRGYAVIPVQPMNKTPLCTLTLKERHKADAEARQEGHTQHECGVKEYITDDIKAQRVFARLAAGYGDMQLNIGIVAHPSRIVVVDCDQAEEVAAFQRQWAEEEDNPDRLGQTPTVLSPGLKDGDEWVHRDGGHFIFDLPEGVELPISPGYYKDQEGKFDVKWGLSQSLVGPSIRAEGPYIVTADVDKCPEWLLQRINRRIVEHEAHVRAKAALVPNDSIGAWSQRISWSELLLEDGWAETHKSDNCGCPIYTRPGGGSTSWKSATGHNGDCPLYQNVEAHGPLHVWSTNAPAALQGRTSMTKLTYYTLVRCNGDEDAAMAALGLERASQEGVMDWVNSMEEHIALEASVATEEEEPEEDDPETSFLNSTGIPEAQWSQIRVWAANQMLQEAARGLVEVQRALDKQTGKSRRNVEMLTGEELWTAYESPVQHRPKWGKRSDGCRILYEGRTSVVAGRPGTGKSWLSILIASQVLGTGGKVAVLDFEDTPKLSMTRMVQIGVDIKTAIVEERLMYADTSAVLDMGDMTMMEVDVKKFAPDFIIVDSANALISNFGAIEDNTLVTNLYRRLAKMAQDSNAAMLIVDHLPKNRENKSAIGAQAKQAALTGTFFMLEPIGFGFAPGRLGSCLLSFHEKDRLGGVAEFAEQGQVAVLNMWPNMWAPPGMTQYDGLSMTMEPPPKGGLDTTPTSNEDKARQIIIGMLDETDDNITKQAIRQSMSSELRAKNVLEPAIQGLLDDGLMDEVCPRPLTYRAARHLKLVTE